MCCCWLDTSEYSDERKAVVLVRLGDTGLPLLAARAVRSGADFVSMPRQRLIILRPDILGRLS